MALSIPKEILDGYLPKMGNAPIPQVETDKEALIFRGALQIQGKVYDIYLHMWDDNGEPIEIKDQTAVLKRVIQEVQGLAQSIFGRVDNPENALYFYSDLSPDCIERNLESGEDHPIYQKEKTLEEQYETVQDMAKIHKLFFQKVISAVGGEKEICYAKLVAKEPVKPVKKQKEVRFSETPQQPLKATPTPILTSEEEEEAIQPELTEAIEEVSSTDPFLKGISYQALSEYSRKNDKDPKDPLYQAYQVFQQLVQKRTDKQDLNKEEKAMFTWLQDLYRAAYQKYRGLGEWYRQQEKSSWEEGGGTFDHWCRYYAAATVAGFIHTKQRIEPLIATLLETSI